MSISFEAKVAIVTAAVNGRGRSHALELAARGAKIVVNDVGSGASSQSAAKQTEKFCAAAMAHLQASA